MTVMKKQNFQGNQTFQVSRKLIQAKDQKTAMNL